MTKVVVEIEAVIGQFEDYDDEIRRLKKLYTDAEVKAAAHLNEIERLREALRVIANNKNYTSDMLARAALGEKE